MGRPFRVSAPKRSFFYLRYRLVLVLFILLLLEQHHLFFVYRDALAAKYSSTEFEPDFRPWQPWIPDEEVAHSQDRIVANRATWRTLGKGWEGETFVYEDSVIKTFKPGRSPFRNCAPGTAREMWPTEIPASMYFGGTESNATSFSNGFLPVRAYFMAVSSDTQAEWHLVTPLLKDGSLANMANNIRNEGVTYRNVDAQYRSAFEHLLSSLQSLHNAGYCHDDIKPANIFVADDTRWILGDLGNLRHVTHPYHSSMLWSENGQLGDCRVNDNIRALKSYIRFVRDSALDIDTFNTRFFERREPLSRLFWSTATDSWHLSATDLRARSTGLSPQLEARDPFGSSGPVFRPRYAWLSVFSRRWRYHYAVNDVLQTRMGENMARWWAMTWVFGVPVKDTCGG